MFFKFFCQLFYLYVLVMSRTRFRVNRHSIVAWLSRNSLPEAANGGVLWKKVFLEISQNSEENTFARDSFLIKLQPWGCNFIKRESLTKVFSCEFCEISKNTFFIEHLRTTAFVLPRSRHEILSLSDCNWAWTYKHLVHKRTLNHLAKPFSQ